MALRSPPPPRPTEVRLAIGYLLRVAQTHARHVEDLASLQGILLSLAKRQRLTPAQAARTREAQDEFMRAHASRGRLADPDARAIDRATAVDAALKRRLELRDRAADAALRKLTEAARTFEDSYVERATERQSVDVFDAVRKIYSRVRTGLTLEGQRAEIASAFESAGLRLRPRGLTAMVRTPEQIREVGGPSDCAKQRVGLVFGNSEGTMAQRVRSPTPLPAGITFFALAQFSNLLDVTEYALRTVGWSEGEASALLRLARTLYNRNPRSDTRFFYSPPSA